DPQRREREAAGVDLEQGDVGVGVDADDLAGNAVAVAELDVDLLGAPEPVAAAARDDVGVRGDMALLVDDEAAAEPALAVVVEQRRAAAELRDHGDDAGGEALVDRRGVE